ncbi:hypothetical protein BDR03DRAFT_875047 [Suillus americanus]|nr:hypothetical protein BDR03DRAFT_875047 [Suillus americanus]
MLVVHPASCCDVCLDPYSISSGPAHSPHAIACGHIFCLTCLRSLSLSACPLCREPFQPDSVKKLYITNPSKRDNDEQDTIDDQHANLLLHRLSLVSGEDTPDAEVVKVVTEVQEWLISHSGDLNSVSHFHCVRTANATYTSDCCYYINFSHAALSINHFELP